jgi:hypothetical protein
MQQEVFCKQGIRSKTGKTLHQSMESCHARAVISRIALMIQISSGILQKQPPNSAKPATSMGRKIKSKTFQPWRISFKRTASVMLNLFQHLVLSRPREILKQVQDDTQAKACGYCDCLSSSLETLKPRPLEPYFFNHGIFFAD